jgi:AAA+ ATPase superfamily predicted ATPase
MFVNRQAELELLERRYAAPQAELFVLYGRRRVGKTELLAHFCQGKRHIFFVADLSSETVLRANLSAALNAESGGPDAPNAVYATWEDLLRAIGRRAQDERLVLVLDEFTYLLAAHPPLASILQRLWDSELRHTRLMLILCGSYIGMMEEEVLGYRAPLYGRRTAQYLLEPLGFYDACLFFQKRAPVDQVRLYAVLGGTPAYLRQTAAADNPLDFVSQHILTRGTFLYDEARFVLQQELREPRHYFAVLEAIAAGHTRLNDIKQATGLESVTPYLDTLQNLRLIERQVPVTENQPHKSRRGLYRMRDPFFRFWFRFVHPNRSTLERGNARPVAQHIIKPQFDSFVATTFEEICQQAVWRLGQADQLPLVPLHVGSWWRASEEIDVVALNEEAALLIECKWTTRPIGQDILRDLERKVSLIKPELGQRKIYLGLCARSGFTPHVEALAAERADVVLLDLPRLVAGK